MEKTLEEMQAWAKSTFGEDAEVFYSDYQWVINTGVEEREDWTGLEDTPAWRDRDQLERWAWKNGYGSSSTREVAEAYNEVVDRPVSDHGDPDAARGYLDRNGVSYEGLTDKETWELAVTELDKSKTGKVE